MKIVEIACNVVDKVGEFRGNAGDTAIETAFEFIYANEFSNPEVTRINARKIFSIVDIDEINKHDLLIVAGGGLFLRDSVNPLTGNVFKNNLSGWTWGISQRLIEKIKIPIIVHSIGFNKFRGQKDFGHNFSETVNTLLEKSIFFSCRNTGSIQALKKYTNPKFDYKIKLNYCPTLLLNEKYKFENKLQNKNVAFVLAGDRLDFRHENFERFTTQIKYFHDYLKFNGYKTILINHLYDNWITDFGIKFDSYIDLYGKTTYEIYKTYSEIDTVVSDRGHGLMIPFSVGCKILSPVSHDKLKWFLNDMNIEEYGIEEYDYDLARKLIIQFEIQNKIDWKIKYKMGMNKIKLNNIGNQKYYINRTVII